MSIVLDSKFIDIDIASLLPNVKPKLIFTKLLKFVDLCQRGLNLDYRISSKRFTSSFDAVRTYSLDVRCTAGLRCCGHVTVTANQMAWEISKIANEIVGRPIRF